MYLRKVHLSPNSAKQGLLRVSWSLTQSVACTATMMEDFAFFSFGRAVGDLSHFGLSISLNPGLKVVISPSSSDQLFGVEVPVFWCPVLVSEGNTVYQDVDCCDVEEYVQAEDVEIVESLCDLFSVAQGWFCREVLHGCEDQFVPSVVFGVCEFGVSGAIYRVPYVCWGEAGFSNSVIPFNGADHKPPLSCVGGGGCSGCLLW